MRNFHKKKQPSKTIDLPVPLRGKRKSSHKTSSSLGEEQSHEISADSPELLMIGGSYITNAYQNQAGLPNAYVPMVSGMLQNDTEPERGIAPQFGAASICVGGDDIQSNAQFYSPGYYLPMYQEIAQNNTLLMTTSYVSSSFDFHALGLID